VRKAKGKSKQSSFFQDCFNYYRATLSPRLNFEVKETESMDLGLFAKENCDTSTIWGILYYLDDPTTQHLLDKNYPSLYTAPTTLDTAVLCGPLSLVNHHCKAKSGFSKPISRVPQGFEDWFGGFNSLWISHSIKVNKGEEILVKYCENKELKFECKC
jgi:hypothetical protein